MRLALGPRQYDVSTRALVMGILNRTTDSFFDKGRYFALDDLLRLAEEHNRALRLLALRKWERREAAAGRRARAARSALR